MTILSDIDRAVWTVGKICWKIRKHPLDRLHIVWFMIKGFILQERWLYKEDNW